MEDRIAILTQDDRYAVDDEAGYLTPQVIDAILKWEGDEFAISTKMTTPNWLYRILTESAQPSGMG